MEVLGAPFAFRFPASAPTIVAFRRPPPAFRSPPPPYLSHAPPPQRHGNRWLTSQAIEAAALPTPPEPVDGESRAILRDFLTEHGMESDLAERSAASWDETVELLSSKLRALHESEQLLGVHLSQPQLTDLFTPYLRSLLKECGDVRIVGGDDQLPSSPGGEGEAGKAPTRWHIKKRNAIVKLEKQLWAGCPPPSVLHLMELGLDLHQVLSLVKVRPSTAANTTIKRKIDGLMEFLISLGLPESDVPQILRRCPQLLDLKIEENILPAMQFLESKGVDKAMWSKIIYNCPGVLVRGKAKVEAIVRYFSEIGLSAVETGMAISHHPRLLCLSIEGKIKPITRFFLDNGFTMNEIGIILLRSGSIFTRNLERILMPKWDFFLTMGYTRSDLVVFPFYFNYDLEKRIKPRYELATKLGIRWSLSYLLSTPDAKFQHAIDRHEKAFN